MKKRPIISAIVAVSENNVIGRDNALLWHIPADFKHFKATTMGKPMIMGRKTFQSLPGVLPGRPHIVLSRAGFTHEGVERASSLDEAIEKASQQGTDEIFIIGGAQLYKQALPLCQRLYLTRVHRDYDGDAFFPRINRSDWSIVAEDHHKGDPPFTFTTMERRG